MRGTLVAICLVLACAHQPRPPPLAGWHELRSDHFRLRTDLTPDAARLTLERLEVLRAAVQSAFTVPGDTPDTADVVVLGDTTELLTFTDWLGLATVSGSRPLLVTAGVSTSALQDELPFTAVLAHELTHVLARWRMPSVAPWFEEGLAELLGTVQIRDGPRARFGQRGVPPPGATGKYLAGSPPFDPSGSAKAGPPLESAIMGQLLSLDELDHLPWQFPTPNAAGLAYRSARLWVQALRLQDLDRVVALETALRRGTPWRTGWADARRGLDVGELGVLVQQWVIAETLPFEEHPFAAPDLRSTERTMSPWEVRLVLADLWTLGAPPEQRTERLGRARTELEFAAQEAPGEALPRVRLAELEPDPDARLPLAEAVAREHPDSTDAAVFLAKALRDDGRERSGRSRAIARAVALAPDDPDALTAQAMEQARAGQVDAALRTARRAVAHAPWSPTAFRVEANLLAAIGRCEEALDAAQRALGVLPHRAPPELIAAVHRDQTLIGSSCSRDSAAVH
ncbi:MAG TPA: hypothetical protein VMT11_12960 [Myxococcaceae bacterium]|nr:hypothetical protein [Myxococcaceae bacterium]